jgi:MFS family permease
VRADAIRESDVDQSAARFDRRLLLPMVLGAVLNPVNSSILAVTLVPIGHAFGVPPSQTAWLVTSLYVATAIGQPVTGRLIDRFGPRRLFLVATVLTGIGGLIGTLAPAFSVLVVARVVIGLGTCAGYPAAMTLIRSEADRTGEKSPAGILTVLAVSSQTIAVIGPTLGGLLVAVGGWRATFAVNLPLALVAWLSGSFLLPRITPVRTGEERATGVLRAVAGNWALLRTYARMLLAMTVAYAVLYGYAQWLQQGRGLHPAAAGLLLLPVSLMALVISALTGRRMAIRGKLVAGAAVQVVAALLMLLLGGSTYLWLLVGFAAVCGLGRDCSHSPTRTPYSTKRTASTSGPPPDCCGPPGTSARWSPASPRASSSARRPTPTGCMSSV